jgi:hypothetical protein
MHVNISNFLSSFVTILEATFRFTLGCHGGSPSPFDTYDILVYLYFFCFIKPFILYLV